MKLQVQSVEYIRQYHFTFNAVRLLDEVPEGDTFHAQVVLSCGDLGNDGQEIVPKHHLQIIFKQFNGINLNELFDPFPATNENIARRLSQAVMDYLFRAQLDTIVKLVSLRLYVMPEEYVEVRHHYIER